MSRSSKPNLFFDSEIEKTAKKLRKEAKARKLLDLLDSQADPPIRPEQFVEEKPSSVAAEEALFAQTDHDSETESDCEEETDSILVASTESDMADDPSLCDLSSHEADDPPTPIRMPAAATAIEIELRLLNVLPKYYGKKGEDPYNFLSEFIKICKTNALKKEISGAKQEYDESLSAYWTRFRILVDSCPNHKFSEGDLLQYFYQGMTVDTKNLVNSASGGGFSQNSVSEAKRLIQHLVEATREYEEPRIQLLKKAAQASSSDFKEKLEARMGKLERMLSTVVEKLQQSQAEKKVQIEGLSRQMSQLATSMNQLKGNNGTLPSQVHVNPKENVNKITLRSGTELDGLTPQNSQDGPHVDSGVEFRVEEFERSVDTTDPVIQQTEQSRLAKQNKGPTAEQKGKGAELESNEEEQTKVSKPLSLHDPKVATSVPFPGRLARKKPEEELIDFVKIFGKLEVNLPFLQALKIPPFGKFVKDFIAGKSKATGKIVMGENVSAALKKELPAKCKDPGMFSLPIYIGDTRIEHAMCDLGASINVMPLTIYNRLSGVELVDTRVVIQLADRSCVYPEGLLENVLVSVNNFVYPADFYVVRMSGVQSKGSTGVLLGRPFLRTAKSIIDVSNGTICLDYHGEKYTFSMDDAMKMKEY
ncbi:uncharacterized protein LOC131018945 [Salvia miltiorrhiza]|uniref:uncharacterized protein LOC131018945 n=1 Tax=Salvia miltiorrhiza TaxID=226208 RepID=UPI0025AC6BE2|nr:uncharacterized protein LOC131018945 [Salvia miltiorrhiza]